MSNTLPSSTNLLPPVPVEVAQSRHWAAYLEIVRRHPAWLAWLDENHEKFIDTPHRLKRGLACRSDVGFVNDTIYRLDENCAHNDFLYAAVDTLVSRSLCVIGTAATSEAITMFAAEGLPEAIRSVCATPHQSDDAIGWEMTAAAWSSKSWQAWRNEYHRRRGVNNCESAITEARGVDGIEYRKVIQDRYCDCFTPFSETVAECRKEADKQLWRLNNPADANPARFIRGAFPTKLEETDRARRTAMGAVAKPEDLAKLAWCKRLPSPRHIELLILVAWQAGSDAPNYTYGAVDFDCQVAAAFAKRADMEPAEASRFVASQLASLKASVEEHAPSKTVDAERVSWWEARIVRPAGRREGRWASFEGLTGDWDSDAGISADRLIPARAHLDYTVDPADAVIEAEEAQLLSVLGKVITAAQRATGDAHEKARVIRDRICELVRQKVLPGEVLEHLAAADDSDLIGSLA